MVQRIKIVKKKKNTFNRFEHDRYERLDRSWRRPHGIDCRVRRRYRGTQRCPKIGYGSNKKTRHLLPNYKLKFVVHNMKELECLMMNNEKYCAEIAHTVGAVLRKEMLKRAKELSINITNIINQNEGSHKIQHVGAFFINHKQQWHRKQRK